MSDELMAYIEAREDSGLNKNPCTINGDSPKAAMFSKDFIQAALG